jgi:hypothetical protein
MKRSLQLWSEEQRLKELWALNLIQQELLPIQHPACFLMSLFIRCSKPWSNVEWFCKYARMASLKSSESFSTSLLRRPTLYFDEAVTDLAFKIGIFTESVLLSTPKTSLSSMPNHRFSLLSKAYMQNFPGYVGSNHAVNEVC